MTSYSLKLYSISIYLPQQQLGLAAASVLGSGLPWIFLSVEPLSHPPRILHLLPPDPPDLCGHVFFIVFLFLFGLVFVFDFVFVSDFAFDIIFGVVYAFESVLFFLVVFTLTLL